MKVLVTGGASSGKSACAEEICAALGGRLVYLATMRPYGDEGARRVARHRAQRAGKGFSTVECYGDLARPAREGALDGATVLLECLGNAVANDLFGEGGPQLRSLVPEGLAAIASRAAHLVVVGNEVGCDGAAYPDATQRYRRELGRVACEAAAASDLVIECVAGVPSIVKGAAPGMPAGPARVLASCGGAPC